MGGWEGWLDQDSAVGLVEWVVREEWLNQCLAVDLVKLAVREVLMDVLELEAIDVELLCRSQVRGEQIRRMV